jgi:hypothetical protein
MRTFSTPMRCDNRYSRGAAKEAGTWRTTRAISGGGGRSPTSGRSCPKGWRRAGASVAWLGVTGCIRARSSCGAKAKRARADRRVGAHLVGTSAEILAKLPHSVLRTSSRGISRAGWVNRRERSCFCGYFPLNGPKITAVPCWGTSG